MTKTLTQPFKWIGSKVRMRPRVLEIIETIPRKLYVEPFGGSAAILLGKEPENSVYNDLNGLLVNFFRVIRSPQDREKLREIARYTPANYDFWHDFKNVCKAYLTHDENKLKAALEVANLTDYPVEIAVAFALFYCQSLAFGGSVLHSYGEHCKPRGGNDHASRVSLFDDYADRLVYTVITNRDFRDCFAKHDDPQTLFYCDPPYECESSNDYKTGWKTTDTTDLVDLLCRIQGSAVLSCYDADVYKPLLDAGYEKKDYAVNSSVRRGIYDNDTARVETIYWRRSDANREKIATLAARKDVATGQRTLF